jgi:hypothetical protein
VTAVNALWGTSLISGLRWNTALTDYALSAAATGIGWTFNVPKTGTITHVGFLITAFNGTPPAYTVALRNLDTSTGAPSSGAGNYGASAPTSYTPVGTGWVWVALGTPATAVAGEFAGASLVPSGSAPNGSDNISIPRGTFTNVGVTFHFVTSAYVATSGGGAFAVKYNDGTVYGAALTSSTTYTSIRSNTTPDELGCKFTLPAAMTCSGAALAIHTTWGASATGDIVLYDGSDNVVASTSITDKDYVDENSSVYVNWGPVNLTGGATYRLVVKGTATTSGDIVVTRYLLDSTDARAFFPCGVDWQATERTDAGAWTDTATSIAPMALLVSDITFSGGGGSRMFKAE